MSNIISSIRRQLANRIYPIKNSMSLPKQFLKYGSKQMTSDWTQIVMSDRDLYTGYGYAAIRNRSNMIASTAKEGVKIDSNNKEAKNIYLDNIRNSRFFSEYDFWFNISTFIDLEGVFYLYVLRNVSDTGKVGDIQYLKLLNPYNIQRIVQQDTLEVGGYRENRKGFVREIPKEQIIEIRELNPFSEDENFAMTDAAKESQFTLKTAGDYTRHTLKHNINAPGILSTDEVLDDEDFKNFTNRVKNHTKGEPIFGNGSNALKWDAMQNELSKSALKDVNDINVVNLLAVAGVSKTIMGIEQSGVTRETSKVQRELFVENQGIPRIQLIIDALNMDSRKYYGNNSSLLKVDNPLGNDHSEELEDANVKEKKLEIYTTLINKGVDKKSASMYINGELELEALNIEKTEIPAITEPKDDKKNKDADEVETESINEVRPTSSLRDQEGALKNQAMSIEAELVSYMISKVTAKKDNKVQIDSEEELIEKKKKKKFMEDLAFNLVAFYGIIVNLQGKKTMTDRFKAFGLGGLFSLNTDVKRHINEVAELAAESHISTVVSDIYETASDLAKQGKGIDEIVRGIRKKYSETVSETRALTLARTETNRAFTIAQYEADKQFIRQNNLEGQVFKKWNTRSLNPCPFCLELASEGPIPFDQNFRSKGDSVVASESVLKIEYDHLYAGNAHPNCACDYELIIRNTDNSLIDNVNKHDEEIKNIQKSISDINFEDYKNNIVIKLKEMNELSNRLSDLYTAFEDKDKKISLKYKDLEDALNGLEQLYEIK